MSQLSPSTPIPRPNAVSTNPNLGNRVSSRLSQLKIPVKEIPDHLPRGSYPVTRSYPRHPWWGRVHLVLYIGAVIAIAVLIVVAYATQGYEPKTVLYPSYNTTQHFWYTPFISKWVSSRTLCDPHVFLVGDNFQTSQSTFAWNLDYLTSADSKLDVNDQGHNYTGRPLLPGTCWIENLQVSADLPSWTSTAIVSIQCDSNTSFPVSASTSFVSSPIPEKASLDSNRLDAVIRTADPEAQNQWAAQLLLYLAGLDILTTLRMNMDLLPNSVTSFAVTWDSDYEDSSCSTGLISMDVDAVGFSNTTLSASPEAKALFKTFFRNTTANFMQTMTAAVNLDIGSPCPSFLTHPSMGQQSLYPTPDLNKTTASSYYVRDIDTFINTLGSDNADLDVNYGFTLPLYAIESVYINAEFLCHLSERKSVLSFLIAIVSSTYALFKTGWGAAMIIVLFFAPKPTNPNYCDGHVILEEQIKSLPNSPMKASRGSTNSGYFQAMPTFTHREGDVQISTPQDDIQEKV